MHQDLVARLRGHQGDADFLLALAGVDDGELIAEQAQHGDLYGDIGAGDADVVVALRCVGSLAGRRAGGAPECAALASGDGDTVHATTPGASTPGCSKKTWTSS